MREFQSPGAFARFLSEMDARLPEARTKGLEAAAKLVEAEVKAEIGHYQDAINGLPAWAQLADATQEQRTKLGFTPNDPLDRTGGLRDSVGYTVHADHAEVGSTSQVMAWQEFGTPDAAHPIPPRPVIGGSLFRRADDAVKVMVGPTIKVLEGEL